jgi:hypothetical protein
MTPFQHHQAAARPSYFLHVSGDARDGPSHSSAQLVDIYMLKFRKPG